MASHTVALAHAPEGAGNATRMIGVAAELRRRGHEIAFAGGGRGTLFAALNDLASFEPEPVEFITDRRSSVVRALGRAVPTGMARFADFRAWFQVQDPALLLTDDPFAVAAARLHGVPFCRLDHSTVDDFDGWAERLGFRCFNGYCRRRAEEFFYTSLLSAEQTGYHGLTHVGPVVHETADPDPVDPFDVLVIPGTYSEGFDRVVSSLREDDYDVTVVGGPDWEPVPAMVPYAAAADAVLCTGYSSIAESAVAGTHCVVMPFIDAQRGVAARLERHGIEGISVVHSLEAAERVLRDPGATPDYENATPDVVDTLERHLADLD